MQRRGTAERPPWFFLDTEPQLQVLLELVKPDKSDPCSHILSEDHADLRALDPLC